MTSTTGPPNSLVGIRGNLLATHRGWSDRRLVEKTTTTALAGGTAGYTTRSRSVEDAPAAMPLLNTTYSAVTMDMEASRIRALRAHGHEPTTGSKAEMHPRSRPDQPHPPLHQPKHRKSRRLLAYVKDSSKRDLLDVLNIRRTLRLQRKGHADGDGDGDGDGYLDEAKESKGNGKSKKGSIASLSAIDENRRRNENPSLPRLRASVGSVSSSMSNSLLSSFRGNSFRSSVASKNGMVNALQEQAALSAAATAILPRGRRRRQSDEVSGNVIHLACQWHPPLHVLELLVKDCGPAYVFEQNVEGQTPLHVAAARGASPQVIKFLLSLYSGAASVQDNKGRTPLHMACECSRRGDGWCDTGVPDRDFNRRSSSWSMVRGGEGTVVRSGPLLSVVKALVEAAPDAVNVLDYKRRNALEYAIFLGAGFKVVKALHKASEQDWQRLRSEALSKKKSDEGGDDVEGVENKVGSVFNGDVKTCHHPAVKKTTKTVKKSTVEVTETAQVRANTGQLWSSGMDNFTTSSPDRCERATEDATVLRPYLLHKQVSEPCLVADTSVTASDGGRDKGCTSSVASIKSEGCADGMDSPGRRTKSKLGRRGGMMGLKLITRSLYTPYLKRDLDHLQPTLKNGRGDCKAGVAGSRKWSGNTTPQKGKDFLV